MSKITAGVNFQFIQETFVEAKTALIEQRRTGVDNPNRLKGIGLEGASRTGKTWDICNFLCHYLTTYTNKSVNVCRDYKATLNKTIYETFRKVWQLWGLPKGHFNKSATPIHFNGNVVKFIGINDDIMTAHGLESDLLVINEAMNIAKETFDQLEQRTIEFFILDYNPSASSSWLFDMEQREDYKNFHTTIFDNTYAPLNAKQKILSYAHSDVNDYHIAEQEGYNKSAWEAFKIKNEKNGTADSYMWQVYGLGIRAVSEDTIFRNIDTYKEEPDPKDVDWAIYGGDFGYINDPTCYVKVSKVGRDLYVKTMFSEVGLMNNNIAEKIKILGVNDQMSSWDSAEKKSVDELVMHGINACYVDKGYKIFRVQKLQQFRKIYIYYEDVETIKDFRNYRWMKEKRTGELKRNALGHTVPVDGNDHAIDATGYALMFYYQDTIST